MASVRDVEAEKVIAAAAEKLKAEIKEPDWAKFVKTGVSRERPPQQKDWWFIRSASMLRKIYLDQPSGTIKLRKVYGSRKNRGHKPERKRSASGKIIRTILQQLEAQGYLKTEKGKGRVVTSKGQSFLQAAVKAAKT